MSGTSSGAKPSSSGSAKFREHSHGRQDREFTPEQQSAVQRIKRCKTTEYYEILAISKDASESQIKKAYHKLSLATHPDKNGAPGADEAFKLVSKAVQVLSDTQKRAIYDQTGGDPETRMPSSSGRHPGAGNPFAGFGGGGPGGMFADEVSPEDLFNMFFNGGGMGMGGGGTTFTFGGPGIRVHQFGGNPGMRTRRAAPPQNAGPPQPLDAKKIFWQLLPLLFLFILPMLSGWFSGEPTGPKFSMQPKSPYTEMRNTVRYDIPYWVNPVEMKDLGKPEQTKFDKTVEGRIIADWNQACRVEQAERERRIQDAVGIIFTDQPRLARAKAMPMPSCQKLREAEVRRKNLLETRNAPK